MVRYAEKADEMVAIVKDSSFAQRMGFATKIFFFVFFRPRMMRRSVWSYSMMYYSILHLICYSTVAVFQR